MNPFQKLLQSALGKGLQRVPGIIDNLGAPIQRSVGNIADTLADRRPMSKFGQRLVNEVSPGDFFRYPHGRNSPYLGGFEGIFPSAADVYKANFNPTQRFLQQYAPIQRSVGTSVVDTAASLKPTSFSFDDPLTLLKGQARYAQRQIQGGIGQGIGQVGSIYKNLQGIGSTALNPLATRTPTTLLGKVGKAFNPLNPVNIGGLATGGLISTVLSENDPNKGNAELYTLIPGGLLPKIATTTILGATPAGVSDEQEANLIRQSNARSQFGKNYKVNGIEYDVKTGRAINPPANVFIPARSDSGLTPPAFTGGGQSNAAGTPEQRRNVSQRAMIVDALAAPPVRLSTRIDTPVNTMSSDAQLYPTELAARYGQEQAYGNELLKAGTLVPRLQEAGVAPGMPPENFAAWAKANPGLAVRLLGQAQGG
jgi:hypothetical protein